MSESTSKQQLMIARQQLDKLSIFIANLVTFLHGANPRIDSELKQIKKLLSGKPNYDAASELSVKLNEQLKIESKYIKQRNLDTLSQIQSSLRKIIELDAVDESTKADIKVFLDSLTVHSDNISSPINQFEQALKLFRQALSNNIVAESQSALNAQQAFHARITQELQELLVTYSSDQENSEILTELKQKLEAGLDHQQLLECCLAMIRFMIKDVIREASSASRLIHDIHRSISKINVGIKTTIEKSKSRMIKRVAHNDKMREQISEIEAALSETLRVEKLKQQTQDCLSAMQASLSKMENQEKAEQVKMIALLESMQKRLGELEDNAKGYKQKLVDQRVHAMTDQLTQLPNRMAYEEKIVLAFNKAKQTGSQLCLAIFDIDHFKRINDEYGHSVGDKTLKIIATQIKKNLHSRDFVARWGGEEFIAFMPELSLQSCYEKLEEIRLSISNLPFMFKGTRVKITVSIGLGDVSKHSSIQSAFDHSDEMLYKAKQNGRNQIQIEDAK